MAHSNFCPQCGAPLAPGQNFCPVCGAPVAAAPQQPVQPTQPFTPMGQGAPAQQMPQANPTFTAQPAGYQPVFNRNGQVTGQQTGAFHQIPQSPAMETDTHGVPSFMKKKK